MAVARTPGSDAAIEDATGALASTSRAAVAVESGSGPGETGLLAGLWQELAQRGASVPALQVTVEGSDVLHPQHHQHGRLLQSAGAVQGLNQRLGLDMSTDDRRLACDRLTAFVANVSLHSGIRPDEVILGSGSDAFVVQNDASGRSIAKFDIRDAVATDVGASLDKLAMAPYTQADAQIGTGLAPDLPSPAVPRAPVLG